MAAARKRASKSTRSRRSTRSSSRGKKKTAGRRRSTGRKWSSRVTRTSHAMDTKQGIFKSKDPDKIAHSLLRSAKASHTRKTTPFQSAMSLLNFYENRGGKNLSSSQKKVLDRAKHSLREQAGRSTGRRRHASRRKRSRSR